jgi:hypothetical protein
VVAEWYHPATTMPNVTLRLTDEQHRLLSEDAARNDRSLQKEIVHRLFRWPTVAETTAPHPGYDSEAVALAHFKPDPKPVKKK